jgi:O-antigen/teichoic acid export membrane protein
LFRRILTFGIKNFKDARELSIFSLSSVLFNGINTIIGIGVIYFLSPVEIGIWNSLLIVQPYLFIVQLGVYNGLNRELPFLLGSEQNELAQDLVVVAWRFSLFLAIISIVISVIVLLYLFYNNQPTIIFIGAVGVAVLVASEFLINYLLVLYRTKENLLKLSNVYFIQSVLLVLTLPFVIYFGYIGFVFRSIVLASILTVSLYFYRPYTFSRSVKISMLYDLIKVGLPLFTFGYLQGLTKSFSRIILLIFGDATLVGLFTPSAAVIVGIGMIPAAVSQYFYPRMSYLFGKHGRADILWQQVLKFSSFAFFVSIPIVLIGWFVIPVLIENLLPVYMESIFPAQISLLSGAFEAAMIGINVLNSMKAYKWLLILTVAKLLLFFVFQYVLVQLLPPLIGISLGYLSASTIYFILGVFIAYTATHSGDY